MGTIIASILLVANCVIALVVLAKNEEGKSRLTPSGMVWHYPAFHPVIISAVFAIVYTAWTCVRLIARGVIESPAEGARAVAIVVIALLWVATKPRHWLIHTVTALLLMCVVIVAMGGVPDDLHKSVYLTAASVFPSFYWMLRWRAHPVPVRSWRVHSHDRDIQVAMLIWVVVHGYVFRIQILWAAEHYALLVRIAMYTGFVAAGLLGVALAVWLVRRHTSGSRMTEAHASDDSAPRAPHLLPIN